ncbi:hypothetical protein BDK51DRAFT_41448 [Blyttiomyces helicus]|uniref:Uncharacterized protein n=1 Tax=Blyttiomyces helicus TaxID=388810 RepID=A0A4P9WBX1_9FUNG|nr:hypothetical protein BDK51DRAFT_41448 [Blyttiomyces helicus]|eukprot:RKO90131.1 hypothetical protein BDK51DRAFT_41448 [Blyttiomyces helicus]
MKDITFIVVEGPPALLSSTMTIGNDNLSLEKIGIPAGFNCWLRALSGKKAVCAWAKAHDNDMFQCIADTWASDCHIFYAVFRPIGEPSPNETPTPSAFNTPELRQRILSTTSLASLTAALAPLALEPPPGNTTDPLSHVTVSKLKDKITVHNGSESLAVDGEYLLGGVDIKLTKDVWINTLLRNNRHSAEFIELFVTLLADSHSYSERIKDLRKNMPLYTAVKIFLHDLMTFGHNGAARERLEHRPDASFYMSSIYFTPEQIATLLDFPGATGLTFKEILEIQMGHKVQAAAAGTSQDYFGCASHDVAPVVRDIFGIQKGYKEEKAFKSAYNKFEKQWKNRRD